jgi:hypothetical protein
MAKNHMEDRPRELTMDEVQDRLCQIVDELFGEDGSQEWTVNADHDIRVASWHIADLLLGPDDGSMERDDVECQIQQVIAKSFSETAGKDPVFGPLERGN